ncbi:signal peptidase I [Puniceicoccaceae bacterium K14]|nr:signal peptidase I [Puniceicoccaceae bacterium K14]
MEPTLRVQERYVVDKVVYKESVPQRWDIVLLEFEYSGENIRRFSRIVGLPNESIHLKHGVIVINGKVEDSPRFAERQKFGAKGRGFGVLEPITLNEGEYFVLGDNYVDGLDSRYFGPVRAKSLVGKLLPEE